MEILATTVWGMEDIAIEEVKELTGRTATVVHKGMIRSRGDDEDLLILNHLSRSLHRVLLLLLHGVFSSLKDLYDRARTINFARYIAPELSFAVRAERIGDHNFRSMDIEREIGQAIIDSYRNATGFKLRVNLDEPEVIVRVEVRHDTFWLALDTTGMDSLYKRNYRVYKHPAPLNPCLAYCLVRLSKWTSSKSLFDPMCGSGTICIEAARWGNDIPNRGDYALWHLPFLDHQRLDKLRTTIESRIRNRKLKIRGCDIVDRHIEGARTNTERAGVMVEYFKCDATKIPLDSDVIVCNPPYGLRVGSKKKVKRLYAAFMDNLARSDWERAVIITSNPQLMPIKVHIVEKRAVMYGNLPCTVMVMDKA